MTPAQLFRRSSCPLALPSIVAGIRVATVIGVGTATIAAAVGAGGLGEYIFRGLSMVEPTVILAGAVPAALLALTFDGALTLAERGDPQRRSSRAAGAGRALPAVGAARRRAARRRRGHLRGDALCRGRRSASARRISPSRSCSASCSRRPSRRRRGWRSSAGFNLGGTFICDRALRSGDIDLYVEYSGTALTAVFHQPVQTDPAQVLETVRSRYADGRPDAARPARVREHLRHPGPRRDAAALGLRDDRRRRAAVPATWRAGFGYEFLQRADGYPGLAQPYGLRFGARRGRWTCR